MHPLLVIATCVFAASTLRADSPALTITRQLLPSPAPVGAISPGFIPTSDGPQLIWTEPATASRPGQSGAVWETTAARFSAPLPLSIKTSGATAIPRVIFPDGSELTAFFPEKDGRILDLHTQRHRNQNSAPPKPLSSDSWPRSSSTPPLLAAREARTLAVWLNHAEPTPRLFAALSLNAGEQFLLPVRIDDGHPLGPASLVLLRDGSAYIAWLEAPASTNPTAALWLRRLSPAGDPSIPVLIATARTSETLGPPQLALLKDYDSTPAQLLLAHELTAGSVTQIATHLITLPPAESFSQGRPCLTCPPDTATLPGHPLAGRLIRILPEKNLIFVEHAEIPGILPAGKNTFLLDDNSPHNLSPGTRLLARVEQRGSTWHLFGIQILTTPPAP